MGTGTRRQLQQHNIRAKKHLGQNFLLDKNMLAWIADAVELSNLDTVLEIGPGCGNLTVELARRAGSVIAVELDRELEPILRANISGFNNIHIVWGDFLAYDTEGLWRLGSGEESGQRKVAANLPYYITSPVLIKLLTESPKPSLAMLLMQLEVAQRLVAKPGTKEYGSLSVLTQFYTCPELLLRVPPAVFFPRPKVWSAAVRLRFRSRPAVAVADEQFFLQVVRASFSHRRKTVANSLQHNPKIKLARAGIEAALGRAHIDPNRRGETLNLEEFARLAQALTEYMG
jgi:16S rRNA (adenine1518-N6/adenine1519-N6)-dimethyltransferase